VLTGIDDHSRFCVAAGLMASANARAVCRVFTGALRAHGVPDEILTDNGKVFTGRFSKPPVEVLFERICRENGITHRLTAVRSPTTTGKIERFHRTLRLECLAGERFADLDAAQAALDAWVADYNGVRPHQGIGMAATRHSALRSVLHRSMHPRSQRRAGRDLALLGGHLRHPPGPHTVWALYFRQRHLRGQRGQRRRGQPGGGTTDPTDTKLVCAPAGPASPGVPLDCMSAVADDDVDVGPAPTGSVGFFRNAINTPGFIGQCGLIPLGPGLSACGAVTSPVPTGASTIWALYFGDGNYQASADADPVTL
jgi:hypothetical protein